ncbi:MAG: hypothetical protein J6Z41_08415 [Prevotella sp.]|nr:hypothetical protein [Prevotella sp.]
MRKKARFVLMALALTGLIPGSANADGGNTPRYYERITDMSLLESGKYYLVVCPYRNQDDNIVYMAYNGYYDDIDETVWKRHAGKAGTVVPVNEIIDLGKSENHAVPLKLTANTSVSGTVWNITEESLAPNDDIIGVNNATTGESQNYLVASAETEINETTNLWYVNIDDEGVAFVRNYFKTYYLKYDDNNYGGDDSFFRVYPGINEKRDLILYKEMETVDAKTSFTGHGTLYYSNKTLLVPEVVTAKTYTLGTNRVYSHEEYSPGSFIPANSAVVLHGNVNTTYTFPVTLRQHPTRDADNILLGFDNASTTTTGNAAADDDYYFYKLTTNKQRNPNSVGFYWSVEDGLPFTSAAHKAFLAIEKDRAANVREFLLGDDGSFVTDIQLIEAVPSTDTDIVYDLSGRKFRKTDSLPKGIYISNGKKIVIR